MVTDVTLEAKQMTEPLRFSVAEVLTASGLERSAFKMLIHRDVIFGARDDDVTGGGGAGQFRRFSWYVLTQAVTGAALTELGIPASRAYEAAARFSHFGAPGGVLDGGAPVRHVGFPYHPGDGDTWLIVTPTGGRVRLSARGALPDMPTIAGHDPEPPLGFTALDMGRLFHRTCTRLGIDPAALLRERYGRD